MRCRRVFPALVVLASGFLLGSCRHAPDVRATSAVNSQPSAATSSQPSTRVATTIPAWKPGFTHYVTKETALIRRGSSDGDVIYDTIAAGSRVRTLNMYLPSTRQAVDDIFAHVITEDGRDGLISPGRLMSLVKPVVEPAPPAFLPPAFHRSRAPANLARSSDFLLARTRSTLHVAAAIDKGCQYLKTLQQPDGSWDATHRLTALAAGTLRIAEGAKFKGLAPATAVLYDSPTSEIFTLAFRDEISDKRTSSAQKSPGAAMLLNALSARQPSFADTFFGDSIDSGAKNPVDSYYALSAISEAGRDRMEVPINFWKGSDAQWRGKQGNDGGWSSGSFSRSAPSDFLGTAAGFLALSTTSDQLLRKHRDWFAAPTGNYRDAELQSASTWLNRHMPEVWDDIRFGRCEHPCETLWWLDRVMTEAGAIRIDHRVSITQMLQWLLDEQRADGSWGGDGSETAFAVRVFVDHIRPAGVAKLAYDSTPWNQRPNDVRHFTRWLGDKAFVAPAASWLVVHIDDPQEDFNALPILYITGLAELLCNPAQQEKLRRFVEQGGLIVGNSDHASFGFADSFKLLGRAMFPPYEFRNLPDNHPIFMDQMYPSKQRWKNNIRLMGLSNGVRELMLLIPDADISLALQNNQTKSHADAFELLADIMLYAIGRDPINVAKEFPTPLPPANIVRRELTVAQLHVGDNWNPEPGAWPRMDDIMQTRDGLWLHVREASLDSGSLADCKFAHLTGTSRFFLTPERQKELHNFVIRGGTLLIDAAGGSTEFAESAETEMKAVFGNDAVQLSDPLPPGVLFANPGGLTPFPNEPVYFRRQVQLLSSESGRKPRLRVMKLGNRMAVFFSREDLTSAMAGIQSDNIIGYRPQVGVELVRDILLYADKSP